MSGDLVAQEDQARENAKMVASVLAAFYKKLLEEKVDVTTARNLTQKYYERLSNS